MNKKTIDKDRLDRVVADARRNAEQRDNSYREQALKLFPWICGRCGREFDRSNVQELTVHHQDHDHDNNPADGSNWELVCIYCHETDHSRHVAAGAGTAVSGPGGRQSGTTYKPFAGLKELLKNKE